MSKLRPVEEVVEEIRENFICKDPMFTGRATLTKVISQDRHAIHTLLKEGVEKLSELQGYHSIVRRDDILTLIDELFSDKTDTK